MFIWRLFWSMEQVSEQSKPDLVLLHGWGMNQAVWLQWLALLQRDWQVNTLDLPGFGLSKNCPEPYALAALAEQLQPQLPAKAVLCGWSLGGLVAIELAKRYPQQVQALVLLASTPCFMAQADWPGMSARIFSQFQQQLSHNIPLTIQRFLAIQAMGSPSAKDDIKQLRQAILQLPEPQQVAVVGGLELLQSCDLRAELARLQVPVFAGFGRLDTLVPIAVQPALQQLMPAVQTHCFPHASHAPFISHPVESAAWLRQIQQQLPA
ncbi:pimeloyl-ACP methyl ester esterase BioH [Alkalimonas sp. MEB108]|uniref:Pimeloyl-[acyl-carrier protein] methyl ester esterase n=1 Tax=Alkalimonas cellulosilytica TaxID=3058395 RepID=A0ABU7J7F2_9GAMM|nr:pimeloyl-ACP methyl ester esterase BioH [Alkalimonas sp. MEB108]MEE2002223.1 pimeloyl-ACP methyl ester esterase BioH [Alkalimonas sp. MEB108]